MILETVSVLIKNLLEPNRKIKSECASKFWCTIMSFGSPDKKKFSVFFLNYYYYYFLFVDFFNWLQSIFLGMV